MARKLRKPRGFGARLFRELVGNATTETVIMIPVFAIIWGGIYYTYLRHERYVTMAQYTRADTWAYAYDGCRDRSGDTNIGQHTTESGGLLGTISGIFASLMSAIPGGQIDEIEGQRTRSAQRPAVLGEGSARMGHNLIVLCNEPPRSDTDLSGGARGFLGF